MQGTAAEKLALFEKLKARGGFDGEDRVELLKVERMLRTFAATEKWHARDRRTLGHNIQLAWRSGQATALEHAEVAKGRDVGTVTASIKDSNGERQDVPYDVTFAFVV